MSRIGVLNANSQCRVTESSIGAMYLKGHVFKMYRDQLHLHQNICELNNRTKEARPENFMPDQRRFYMKRSRNRGIIYVPSISFLHLRSWANLFFELFIHY